MLHRHPFLSLVTVAYLGVLAWVTLTPLQAAPTGSDLVTRVVARLAAHDPRFTVDRVEFAANVALFVPVGVFLLLLVGVRWWWVAALAGFALTSAIETAQRGIPGRVPDDRDVLANTLGTLAGVALALVLTFPATVRRHRARRRARHGAVEDGRGGARARIGSSSA